MFAGYTEYIFTLYSIGIIYICKEGYSSTSNHLNFSLLFTLSSVQCELCSNSDNFLYISIPVCEKVLLIKFLTICSL